MDIQISSPTMGKVPKWLCGLLLVLAGAAHAGTVTYVYTDPQGTPLAEADANGTITATFDYAPYGSQALGSPPNGPGYTGHVNDPDTGFVYMQARYYDPQVGRFVSTDPVGPSAGNPFNFNRFAYANNNPIVNMDPDGRCTGSLFDNCPGGGDIAGHGYTMFVNPSESEGGGKANGSPAGRLSKAQRHDDPQVAHPIDRDDEKDVAPVPPVFKMPNERQIFRRNVAKEVLKKIDDFASRQIVKRASFKTLTISREGFLEPTPLTFGIYIFFHSPGLGGCNDDGYCADEAHPNEPLPASSGASSRQQK